MVFGWAWNGAAVVVALAAVGCRDATAIELQIDTDLRCDEVRVVTTSIGSGSLETVEARPPSAVTTRCDATGHIGSLVLLPHEDDEAEVAVRVITARKSKDPDECLERATPDCIVARRVARFVPHRVVTLPIRMQDVCSGVACSDRETCVDGRCVSSFVDLAACEAEACEGNVGGAEDAGHATADAAGAATPPPSPTPDAGPLPVPVIDAGVADAATASEKGEDPKPKKPPKH